MSETNRLSDEHLVAILEDCTPQGFPVLKGSELLSLIAEVRTSRAANRRATGPDRPPIDEALYAAMYKAVRDKLGKDASVLLTHLRNAYTSREAAKGRRWPCWAVTIKYPSGLAMPEFCNSESHARELSKNASSVADEVIPGEFVERQGG